MRKNVLKESEDSLKKAVLFLKNEKLVNKLIKPELVSNYTFFQKKYKSFLNDNKDNTHYLWNELILNLSIQNLYSN